MIVLDLLRINIFNIFHQVLGLRTLSRHSIQHVSPTTMTSSAFFSNENLQRQMRTPPHFRVRRTLNFPTPGSIQNPWTTGTAPQLSLLTNLANQQQMQQNATSNSTPQVANPFSRTHPLDNSGHSNDGQLQQRESRPRWTPLQTQNNPQREDDTPSDYDMHSNPGDFDSLSNPPSPRYDSGRFASSAQDLRFVRSDHVAILASLSVCLIYCLLYCLLFCIWWSRPLKLV